MTSPSLLSYYDRYRELVDDWPAFLASLSAPLPICLWTNRLRIAPEALAERLTAEAGLPPHPVSWYPGAFRWPEASSRGPQGLELPRPGLTTSHAQGLFTLQEEAAMLPVLLLAPRPGERILDLCAAPGNKTAQLAVAVGQAGTVVANDLHWARVSPLRRIQERLGLVNLVATAGNGVTFPADERGGPYDAVLVDVPCSCDATLRKNPKVPLGQDDERRSRTAGVQRALLRRALALCRPGGRVVYSTCSFAPQENEAVVNDVLADPVGPSRPKPQPSGRGEQREPPVFSLRHCQVSGLRVSPGLSAWGGQEFHPDVGEKTMRLWPHHNDTGGFFVAVFDVLGGDWAPTGEGEGAP